MYLPQPKQCPSTASTVTSESTVTTSASEAPSLGSCKGLKPSSSTATPPPCQRDERRPPAHYVNVMAPARAFPDPVHASINGVGLPPPRPKSTKPGSHVSTPVGSLGRRSATPMRTESRNGYRNGADGVPAHGGGAGYGLPSSRAHSPMMMQQQYHHYPRAALRDEDTSGGGDLPLSSTPKPYRPDINDELLYADMYEDVKAGRVPDPRLVKPPLPPKGGAGPPPPQPQLPPKARKKAGRSGAKPNQTIDIVPVVRGVESDPPALAALAERPTSDILRLSVPFARGRGSLGLGLPSGGLRDSKHVRPSLGRTDSTSGACLRELNRRCSSSRSPSAAGRKLKRRMLSYLGGPTPGGGDIFGRRGSLPAAAPY
ncbi:hypothetical protein HPB50_002278 [Hyalomma asiaticum]|uniref:Uncharacterized protein n=1 Tax=Hyalomma asiaticum TaxID=266040 RepID=A0ACB7S4G0_HYAAI|nr:hypothetical protein HPB50_002278 [Hyalomma asiaticum]